MPTRTTRVLYDLVARDNASRTFGRVGGAATRLGKQGAGVGSALATGFKVGTVAAAGLGWAALSASGQFEKSMNQVRAVSGATGKDFQDLRNQAKELGATTKFSASEAADGMGFLAMAGFKAKDIMSAMPGVLSLASAGNMDLAMSADIASNILTGYGFKTQQTSRVVDVMAKTFTSTNTNLEQLGEAFKYAGPVTHAAGVKFEETAAAIGLMGNAGIQASMAGTALRGAVTRLLSPTAKVAKTLDKLGVSATDSSGKLLPLNDIVRQLEKSGASTGDMMTIFGQRAGPALLALVDQGSGALVKLTKELENSGGAADKIAKIQMEGLKGQLTSLKSAWEGLMIEIGDLGVLHLATGAVEGVTTSMRGFTGFVDQYGKPAIKTFREQMSDLVPVDAIKTKFGQAKSVVGDFVSGLAGTKSTAKGLLSGLFDNTPHLGSGKAGGGAKGPALGTLPHYGTGQVAPITGVQGPALGASPHGGSGAAAPLTMPEVKPPKSTAQKIGESIRKAVTGGIENLDWGKLGSGLGKGLSTAIGWVGKNTAELTKKFGSILAGIDWVDVGKAVGGQAIPFAIGFIVNLFEPLFSLDFWKEHWLDAIIAVLSVIPIGRIFGVLGKLFGKIPFLRIFEPLFSGIGKLGGLIEKGLGKIFAPIKRGIVSGFKKAFPAAAAAIEREAGQISTRLGLWGLKLLDLGKKAARGIGTGIERGVSWVTEKALGLGKYLLSGLKDGVVSGVKGIGSWLKRRVIDPVVSSVKGWFGINSPSTVFASIGSDLIKGLKNGVGALVSGIGTWAVNTIVTPVTAPIVWAFTQWLPTAAGTLRDQVVGAFGSLRDRLVGFKNAISEKVITPVSDFFTKTLAGAARSARDAVVGAIRWLALKVLDAFGNIIDGAAKLFGWVPGVGKKLKGAAKEFRGFRDDVNAALGGIKDKAVQTKVEFTTASGLKLTGVSAGRMATGGPVFGPGTETSDSVPIMASRNEHMWSAREVRGAGGHGAVERLRELAREGKLMGFSSGGAILPRMTRPSREAMADAHWRDWSTFLKNNAQKLADAANVTEGYLGGSIPSGSGVKRWTSVVQQALRLTGQPLSYTSMTLRRMNQESGGNPRAVNLWDINAKLGHPSVGLMQVIRPTFQRHAGPYRNTGPFMYGVSTAPLANIYASMRYALGAYGSLPSAYNRAGGYDSGGLARGVGFLPKNTPKPERVLSPRQTASFDRLVDLVAQGGMSTGGQFTGQLVLDSGELLGVIQGTVRPMIQNAQDKAAHRAKVGRR
ncbi:phage tail tape measure protein [Streptomyces sp. NPDC048392]|uniref:phage tail tape measure protein n=1 Tax=Streptomyces sp. NPDC048392 TaxID=3365543 RepID=UPI003724617C